MRTWRGRIFVLLFALAAGCRSGGDQELLERELRLLEDEIYHLEDHVEGYKLKLDTCRRQNAALQRARGRGTFEPEIEATTEPAFGLPSRPGLGPPVEPDEPPGEIQLEVPGSRPQRSGAPDNSPGATPPLFTPPQARQQVDESLEVETAPRAHADSFHPARLFDRRSSLQTEEVIEDYYVTAITLNRLLTGGINNDEQPGDEGIMAVVEPRNATGQIINVPGQLSIVVLDPSRRQRESRVARWDFTPNEAADKFHQSLLGRGIHLELPWPAESPTRRQLHLYVRYITADGTEYRTDQPIDVEIPEVGRADRWTSTPQTTPRRQPDGWEVPAEDIMPSVDVPDSSVPHVLPDKRPTDWQTLERQTLERDAGLAPRQPDARNAKEQSTPRKAAKRDRVEWSPYRQ